VVVNAAEIYPCIASRIIGEDAGAENYITFMNYSDGAVESTNPFVMHLGVINFMYVITEGPRI